MSSTQSHPDTMHNVALRVIPRLHCDPREFRPRLLPPLEKAMVKVPVSRGLKSKVGITAM